MNHNKEKQRCPAVKINKYNNFDCGLPEGAHVHVDRRTKERWGEGGPPYGMRRKYAKKYSNAKVHRRYG
jgi:hypothetical protein